ncbi:MULTISPECIES: hypothetical protein [Siminovitchia]|uniref:Chromosome segregation ATPase n=1 Tax=Siminovitchia thermophila TaxID=1245522 RepID=A0ABS2RBR8_9BACI|nr:MULTISPECIES: hypothetical protein [Siminovitchia]MBM7717097.1 chromosome segregation ATPase [Siminovitchia thermophila]
MLKSLREFYDWQQTKKKSYEEMTKQETELKDKLAELDNDRLGALADGDEKKLERVDKEIASTKRKLEITEYQRKAKIEHDPQECLPFAEKIRKEAEQTFEKKQKEDEELRKKIEETKRTYLKLVADHHSLVSECSKLQNEVNEAISPLELSLKRESERLRGQAQELDRKLFDMARPTGVHNDEAITGEMSRLQKEKAEAIRKANEIEAQTKPVKHSVRPLREHVLSGIGSPYFIHEDEQLSAAKGELGKFEMATPTSGQSEFGKDMAKRK